MMRSKTITSLGILAIAGMLASCAAASAEWQEPKVTVELSAASALEAVTRASDELGIDIFGSTSGEAAKGGENTVISPASLSTALAMVSEGAQGDGAAALHALLGAGGQDLTDAINALAADLRAYDGDLDAFDPKVIPERPLVHVANNLVLDDGFAPKAAFVERLTNYYGSGLDTADLSTPAGIDVLSAWVKRHTGGLIEKSAIQPSDDLRLVLQNAVLFAARWQSTFEKNSTFDSAFTTSDGETVTVRMMSDTRPMAYAEEDSWRAVSLPYNEGFRAIVILPPEGTDPGNISKDTYAALTEALTKAESQERPRVDLWLPAMDVATTTDLRDPLLAHGLDPIFEDGNTFTPIHDEGLIVSQIVQQARLIIDEEGTVAAAVTEVGMDATAVPPQEDPIEFHADRPFLFVIEKQGTGWDLFTAVIRNPLAE